MADDWTRWLADTKVYLVKEWGIDGTFAGSVATLLAYLFTYGLSPIITSGFRDPQKQKELAQRYAAGDRSVVVKPAENSLHSHLNWFGKPAARAIDIKTNDPALAAQIATALGVGAGFYYRTPDPVHFYSKEV